MDNKKKCKYCMSEMDENAIVCPYCRKKQPKEKKAISKKEKIGLIILIPIATVLLIIAVYGFVKVVDGILETREQFGLSTSKEYSFKNKVTSYLNSTKTQFKNEDYDKSYMCYYIDTGDYTGSVRVQKDSNDNIDLYIWLSDGTYYASGEEGNVKIVKSSNTAPTNCHMY